MVLVVTGPAERHFLLTTDNYVVREGGLEPPRPCEHWHLKPARLPFRHSRLRVEDSRYLPHANCPTRLTTSLNTAMARKSLEKSMENAFDGVFSRLFGGGVRPLQIGRRLLAHVDAEREVDAQGRRVVPNTYLVHLSATDREGFADLETALKQELTEAVREYIRQEGYHAEGSVRVTLRTNPDFRKGKFDITSRNDKDDKPAEEPASVSSPETDAAPTPAPLVEVSVTAPETEVVAALAVDRASATLTLPNGERVELHEGVYVVGRNLECDIVISDSNVSRTHAEFASANGDVVVRDKGSTNGTKVNGVQIAGDQLLQSGDVINFGTAQVRFETA